MMGVANLPATMAMTSLPAMMASRRMATQRGQQDQCSKLMMQHPLKHHPQCVPTHGLSLSSCFCTTRHS